jgi:hypothetical protein
MIRVGTFLRGVAAIGILSASLHVGPVSAAGNSGKDVSSVRLQMPGERIRQRPQISIDAIRALSLIMHNETQGTNGIN